MGQNNSSPSVNLDDKKRTKYLDFVDHYKFLFKTKDPHYGDISILQNESTKERVCVFEIQSNTKAGFDKVMAALKKNINHPNITKIIRYTSITEDEYCASIYKILLMTEFIDINLAKEITLKRDRHEYYSEDELWYLTQDIVQGMSAMQRNNFLHEDLKPSAIFIGKNEVHKLNQHNNVLNDNNSAYHQKLAGLETEAYLSPALLSSLQKGKSHPEHNAWKSDVYSFGLILLEAATLIDCQDLYNWDNNTINFRELDRRVSLVESRYSHEFLEILCLMLEVDERSRPDFINLEKILLDLVGHHFVERPNISDIRLSKNNSFENQVKKSSPLFHQNDNNFHQDVHHSPHSRGESPKRANLTNDVPPHIDIPGSPSNLSLHDPHGLSEERTATQTYPGGIIYKGQVRNGIPHGKGTMTYPSGGRYIGDWVDGKKQGFGTLYYPSGDVDYEGQWRNDTFHGKGILYNSNPAQLFESYDLSNFDHVGNFVVSYEGYFENGMKHGDGMLILSNQEVFQGKFKEDKVDGVGIFTARTGSEFHGKWTRNELVEAL